MDSGDFSQFKTMLLKEVLNSGRANADTNRKFLIFIAPR